MVDLSQWVKQRQTDFANYLMDCSQIHVQGICMCITEYALAEAVLIPNITNPTEFSKYWFIVPNASPDDQNDHKVTVSTPRLGKYAEVQLIQEGAIASINEYIPSQNAKLKIQCGIRWNHKNDYLTVSTRADGSRHRSDQYLYHQAGRGYVEGGGRTMSVHQNERFPKIHIELSELYGSGGSNTELRQVPAVPYSSSLEIIDDGEYVEMIYNDGNKYEWIMDGESYGQRNHIAIWNCGQPDCVLDITSLKVSVLMGTQDSWSVSIRKFCRKLREKARREMHDFDPDSDSHS